MKDRHEKAVAKTLGVDLALEEDRLPVFGWNDGFRAEVALLPEEEKIMVGYWPIDNPDLSTANLKMAELLRAVQGLAAEIGSDVYLEDQSRSDVGHVLDHLGFSITQEILDDNDFWGEDFDDADYEWSPG